MVHRTDDILIPVTGTDCIVSIRAVTTKTTNIAATFTTTSTTIAIDVIVMSGHRRDNHIFIRFPFVKFLSNFSRCSEVDVQKPDHITVKSKEMRLRKNRTCVHIYITSKRIELESPGCTGFEENSKCFKT